MLKKTFILLLCGISITSPAFSMDWIRGWFGYNAPAPTVQVIHQPANPAVPAVMETESTVKTYEAPSLKLLAARSLAKNTTQSLQKVIQAPTDVQNAYIKSVLEKYDDKKYIVYSSFKLNSVRNMRSAHSEQKQETKEDQESNYYDYSAEEAYEKLNEQDIPMLDQVNAEADIVLSKNIIIGRDLEQKALIISDLENNTLQTIDVEGLEDDREPLYKGKLFSFASGSAVYNSFEGASHIFECVNDHVICKELEGEVGDGVPGSYYTVRTGFTRHLYVWQKDNLEKIGVVLTESSEDIKTNQKAYIFTPQNRIVEWDLNMQSPLWQSQAMAELQYFEWTNEQFLYLRFANGSEQLWDMDNKICVLDYHGDKEVRPTALGAKLTYLENGTRMLWDGSTQSYVNLGTAGTGCLLTKDIIVTTYNKQGICTVKVLDMRTFKLIHEEETSFTYNISFDEFKNELALDGEVLPLKMLQSLDCAIHDLSSEQSAFVSQVMTSVAGLSTKDEHVVEEFLNPEFDKLPALIQRLLCNFLKAEMKAKGYYFVNEAECRINKKMLNTLRTRDVALVAGGALIGVLAYKYLFANSGNVSN